MKVDCGCGFISCPANVKEIQTNEPNKKVSSSLDPIPQHVKDFIKGVTQLSKDTGLYIDEGVFKDESSGKSYFIEWDKENESYNFPGL